jgi:HD-like signal output (HDOD) protein
MKQTTNLLRYKKRDKAVHKRVEDNVSDEQYQNNGNVIYMEEKTMNPKTLVEQLDQLVSLPDVCIRVTQLIDSPQYTAKRMGDIIALDTDLSARLLRLVNSPFFGLRSKVDTISRAVSLIGTNELRNLVMATTTVRSFKGVPDDLVNMSDFWRHGVMTGVMSRLLAKRCNVLNTERFFVLGMLHDVGRLVIYLTVPEKARDILAITGGDDWILADTERELLNFTHMDVGGELMRAWSMPSNLAMIAENHHQPSMATENEFDASIVHVALAVANGKMVGLSVEEMLWAIEPSAWDVTGLKPDVVEELIQEMMENTQEIESFIIPQEHRMRA